MCSAEVEHADLNPSSLSSKLQPNQSLPVCFSWLFLNLEIARLAGLLGNIAHHLLCILFVRSC